MCNVDEKDIAEHVRVRCCHMRCFTLCCTCSLRDLLVGGLEMSYASIKFCISNTTFGN